MFQFATISYPTISFHSIIILGSGSHLGSVCIKINTKSIISLKRRKKSIPIKLTLSQKWNLKRKQNKKFQAPKIRVVSDTTWLHHYLIPYSCYVIEIKGFICVLAKNLRWRQRQCILVSDECIYKYIYTAIEQTQSLRSLCSVVCWFDTIFVVGTYLQQAAVLVFYFLIMIISPLNGCIFLIIMILSATYIFLIP